MISRIDNVIGKLKPLKNTLSYSKDWTKSLTIQYLREVEKQLNKMEQDGIISHIGEPTE